MRQHQQKINTNALSILTLDDDPIITATIQAYFRRSGYHVDVENEPFAAIERVRNGHYDILLLDFLMSPICGDQVVEQIRRFNKDIFIILLTGHKSLAPPIKTIRALDIQGYYEKSDRFDQLELLVESCVKSIRQMRTILNYKDGLSSIVDSLPTLHNLSSIDELRDNILTTVKGLIPCRKVSLTLSHALCSIPHSSDMQKFVTCTQENDPTVSISDKDIEQLLFRIQGQKSILWEKNVVLPITEDSGKTLGLITLEPCGDITYDRLQLLELFARQASSALCNAALHVMVQEKNDQLQNNYLEMVYTMRRVVDLKDPYTCGHSDRVSFYAREIARRMGRDEEYCEKVRIAGLFHDMGKLSIPDEVLLKPERLTDEEFSIIRNHCTNGYELLSAVSQFRGVLQAVRGHHERFDGNGYPDGLKGEEIPEEARIIAVADTFDAMTSNRQYRRSLTFQYACDELNRCKDTQLDAKIVDVFQTLIHDRYFWVRAKDEMGDNLPPHLLLNTVLCAGGEA